MDFAENFEDLKIWQRARAFANEVYVATPSDAAESDGHGWERARQSIPDALSQAGDELPR